jgi:hypothetical protein
VIFADFSRNLSLYEMSCILPYSLIRPLLKCVMISFGYHAIFGCVNC